MGIFGSGSRKRGVFGTLGIDPYRTPGYGDGVGQHWDIEDGASIAQTSATQPQSTRQPSFWQGGDKFGVRDGIAGALAVIGDALSQRGGGQGGAVQMLAGGRMDAMEMAKKAAEQARLEQAARRLGINGDQVALAQGGLGELLPKQPAPNDTERDYQFITQKLGPHEADNWLRTKGDPYVTVPLGPNRIYSGPRSGLGGAMGGQLPTAPVGRLTPIPEAPAAPQAQGAPTLSPEQWRGAVQSLGPQKAEEWRRRNNYQIGGY